MDKLILYYPDQRERGVHFNNKRPEIIRTKEKRLQEMDYPHIVFLGSGAAASNPFRSNAAILVNLT